ncbi:MBL fold metallo-hydrolase [Clostridium luticellarii]|uniref:MBL fold metallo-hydrolase n=1 Tax=Clostridium luticellarii TaxID=1691940 RepID=UPI000D033C66|nr:MBL fold metallo-hydrolase [Clostridium luticellarii]MCI1944352.1 MBL fold metallo-hydrolase [Clostridium luticellarii]MCI1967472.1 MBL fold metallo-hydrolase [Clostridium luticellarii]MCI1994984.1 MBL fold metallo-hydrolase [Clostridium luticellarii]MCI2041023.1 MBL fold metallo-hydrolase [Clostridium luticellarii]
MALFKLSKTQKLTGNIYVVRTLISNFFIYSDCENTICFNTGFMPSIIRKELKKIDIYPQSVSGVFLTYPNFYHIGGIKLFKNADIYFSSDILTDKFENRYFHIGNTMNASCKKLKDGDIVNIGKVKIKSVVFPGHKKGVISYIVNDSILFV